MSKPTCGPLAKLILPLVQWIISILTVVVCGVEIRHRGTMEPKRKTTKGTAQVLVTGTEGKLQSFLNQLYIKKCQEDATLIRHLERFCESHKCESRTNPMCPAAFHWVN